MLPKVPERGVVVDAIADKREFCVGLLGGRNFVRPRRVRTPLNNLHIIIRFGYIRYLN